jgi:MATE family multidrug resistance protein
MSPLRPLLQKAVPIISARLVQNLGLFVGSLMVAQLGKAALAASAIATSLSLTSFAFASSSLALLAPMLSYFKGPDQFPQRLRVMRQGFLMATVLGLVCSALLLLLLGSLRWWHTTDEIKALLINYFYVLMPGYFPMLWTAVFQQYLLGSGRQRYVFWYAVARFLVGTVISYVAIFGIPGLLPGLGFHGLALGVTLGSVVGCLGLAVVVLRLDEFRQLRWWSLLGFEPGVAALLQKAIPIGFQSCLELAAFAVGVQLLTPLGEAALGAHQIVFQFVMLGTMIPYGLCDAVALSVGEARGSRDEGLALASTRVGWILSLAATGSLSLLYLLAPDLLAHLFLRSHYGTAGDTLALVRPYFRIIAFYQILDGSRLITIGALRGRLRTSEALSTSVLAFWIIALPLAAVLIWVFHYGALALPVGLTLGMIAGTISIRRVYQKVLRSSQALAQD